MKKIFKFIIERYLKLLTKIIISRHKPIIVVVAGSSNKTFIKEQILEEFKNGKNIRGNPRSFNTEISLPLAVLFLPSGYSSIFKWADILLAGTYISFFERKFPKILVLEARAQKKGDMKYLLSIIKPMIVVISDISGNFSDNKKIVDEEMARLISSLDTDGTVILNMDNERVEKLSQYSKTPVVFYGLNTEANVRISKIREDSDGQTFDLAIDGRKISQKIESFGLHNVYAATAAQTVSNEIRKFIKNKNPVK